MIAASNGGSIILPDPVDPYTFNLQDFTKLSTDHDAYNDTWQWISIDPKDIMQSYSTGEYVERGEGLEFISRLFFKTYQYIGCYQFNLESNDQFIQGANYHIFINSSGSYYYKLCDE